MRKSLLKIFFLAALMMVAAIGTAFAGPQDFVLVNNTGRPIYYLNVSPADAKEWMPDILGSKVLMEGEKANVTFQGMDGVKLWDLQAEFEDGSSIVWYDIDLYSYRGIILNADATATLQ
ncbi:MAG: hypothetical protein IJS96_10755 [Schwartzia sp.]|nr:hypothetical protein [Schwartzia sp. (in: firmicutes)]